MKKIQIKVSGRAAIVCVDGDGALPLMIVGAAGLFAKRGMMPSALKDTFTLYFVDLWSRPVGSAGEEIALEAKETPAPLTWESIVDEIEVARQALGLGNVVMMGQSAAGAMPIEYAKKYSRHCLLAVPVAFSPSWTKTQKKVCEKFIKKNAGLKRRRSMGALEADYQEKVRVMKPGEAFMERFKASGPRYWKDFERAPRKIDNMWRYYNADVPKVIDYATIVLPGYNFFNRKTRLESVPVLWLLGMHDYSVPVDLLLDRLCDAKRRGELSNVESYLFDAGHYPMAEDPEGFARVLKEKVQQLGLVENLTPGGGAGMRP